MEIAAEKEDSEGKDVEMDDVDDEEESRQSGGSTGVSSPQNRWAWYFFEVYFCKHNRSIFTLRG